MNRIGGVHAVSSARVHRAPCTAIGPGARRARRLHLRRGRSARRPFREIRDQAPETRHGDSLPCLWLQGANAVHLHGKRHHRAQGADGQGAAKRHAGGRAQSPCLRHRLDGAARCAGRRHGKRPHQHRPSWLWRSEPTRLRRRSDQHHELPPRARSPRAHQASRRGQAAWPRTASRAGPIGRR